MQYVHDVLKKCFIFGIKSNRLVAMTSADKKNGRYQKIKSLLSGDGTLKKVYLKGILFPVNIIKKVFKNDDASVGILYLVSNDLTRDADQTYELYKKRWSIEEYHKSIKQNASFEKSPTKTMRSQLNHIFCSIFAFCKLERIKLKTKLNHFAIKYKLIVKANQMALSELANMTN